MMNLDGPVVNLGGLSVSPSVSLSRIDSVNSTVE